MKFLSGLLKYLLLDLRIELLPWFDVLLHPLVLYWLLWDYITPCFGSSAGNYVDISSFIPCFS
jgi:hypothetical protein